MGRHTRGRHRRPSVDPRIVLRAAAVTAVVLTLVAALNPSRAREAALGTTGDVADAQTAFALPRPTVTTPAATPSAIPTPTPTTAPPTSTTPPPPAPRPPAAAPKVVRAAEAAPPPANGPFGQRVIAGARLFIGVPYVWGGVTRSGMDCSGLVYTVLRALGKNPPRTSAAQAAWTKRISKADARPGDLVFGVYPSGVVHHVGIYLGNDQMIDAPNSGSRVGVHPLYRDSTRFGRIP